MRQYILLEKWVGMRERDKKGKGNLLKQCNIFFTADGEGTFLL